MSRDSIQRGRVDTGVHEWLPYSFSIVGAQKSGTSTLSTALDRHPQVARAPRKELQYFTREDLDWEHPDYAGYRAPRRKPQHLIAGDATPAYLFWPHALDRMHAYNPEMRLIAVFRDPLERLFSHWTMLRGRWTTSPDWPDFITEFRPSATPTALPDVPSLAFKQRSGVGRGYYGDQLARGLSIFPRERWLWLEFRAMLADFPTAMDQVTDFLGVDRYHRPPEPAQVMSGPARVVGTAPTATDLASLAQLYSADLAKFRSISDLDVDAWPTARILSGRMSPAELAERFAARVEARPDPAPAHAKAG
ncbi:MAG: sulfotransferase domain-containing protein [Nocardioides sp.]